MEVTERTKKVYYPSWFHAFRGWLSGLAMGCAAVTIVYETRGETFGDSQWMTMVPLGVTLLPVILLATFEIGFGVRRYLALRRRIDARTS